MDGLGEAKKRKRPSRGTQYDSQLARTRAVQSLGSTKEKRPGFRKRGPDAKEKQKTSQSITFGKGRSPAEGNGKNGKRKAGVQSTIVWEKRQPDRCLKKRGQSTESQVRDKDRFQQKSHKCRQKNQSIKNLGGRKNAAKRRDDQGDNPAGRKVKNKRAKLRSNARGTASHKKKKVVKQFDS